MWCIKCEKTLLHMQLALTMSTWRSPKRAKIETPPKSRTVSVLWWDLPVSPLEDSIWIKLILSWSQSIYSDWDHPGFLPVRQIVQWCPALDRLIRTWGHCVWKNHPPILFFSLASVIIPCPGRLRNATMACHMATYQAGHKRSPVLINYLHSVDCPLT